MITEVMLTDAGSAVQLGEGVFTISQADEYGAVQSVVLTEDDLRRLLATAEGE